MATPARTELMRDIERAMARNLEGYVTVLRDVAAHLGPECIHVCEGVAAFTGRGSPLTTVKGVTDDLSDGDVDVIESFFRDHGEAAATVELAPWSSGRAERILQQRGYRAVGHEDVVATTSGAARPSIDPSPRPVVSETRVDAWPELMRASYELADGSDAWALTAASARLPGVRLYGVRDGDRWIAAAESVADDGVVIFGNDGTRPEDRGRGAQRALIEGRLAGLPAGLIVTAEVEPGSGSERNYLRAGFTIAYTRTLYATALA